MARNMKMELLTFSLILYQSKNCGHRIHILFMMYDVYWYCQMKKKEWLWKFWKRNDLYENFEKKGGGGNEIHAPCACEQLIQAYHRYGVGFAPGFVNCKKGALDSQLQVISLPVACPWSVVLCSTTASFSTNTGRHDIAEILLKVALNTKNQKINLFL